MNLDSLLRIGIDAAAAFVTVNIVNVLRQGWLWPAIGRWLKAPRLKRDRQARVIAVAWWVSVLVAGGFALRVSGGWFDWRTFAGEWVSRALISWVLALGQFDIVKLTWPKMFDPSPPGQESLKEGDLNVDAAENVAEG